MVRMKFTKTLKKRMRKTKEEIHCIYCGIKLDETNLSAEHVIPRWLLNINYKYNLTTACISCNKGHKNPLDKENNPSKQLILSKAKEVLNNYKLRTLTDVPLERHSIIIKDYLEYMKPLKKLIDKLEKEIACEYEEATSQTSVEDLIGEACGSSTI